MYKKSGSLTGKPDAIHIKFMAQFFLFKRIRNNF